MAGKRPKGRPERIGRLIVSNAGSPALGARLKELVIWQSWEQAVGPVIAARTQPLRLVGGVLTVTVSSGPWMQQLSFMKAELRDRVNALIGEDRIKEIALRSGRINSEQDAADEQRPPLKPLSPQQQDWIRQQVSAVEDIELQQSMQALMESHYRRV
jgi:hypothetical protein